mmetsp:Transcript_57661/g.160726  ORF Transcript_57661/g.160726 Transcript_57661/m.160726 type:complete len:157 (+) Transcript_57661:981-1451(+)
MASYVSTVAAKWELRGAPPNTIAGAGMTPRCATPAATTPREWRRTAPVKVAKKERADGDAMARYPSPSVPREVCDAAAAPPAIAAAVRGRAADCKAPPPPVPTRARRRSWQSALCPASPLAPASVAAAGGGLGKEVMTSRRLYGRLTTGDVERRVE